MLTQFLISDTLLGREGAHALNVALEESVQTKRHAEEIEFMVAGRNMPARRSRGFGIAGLTLLEVHQRRARPRWA